MYYRYFDVLCIAWSFVNICPLDEINYYYNNHRLPARAVVGQVGIAGHDGDALPPTQRYGHRAQDDPVRSQAR